MRIHVITFIMYSQFLGQIHYFNDKIIVYSTSENYSET